MEMHFFEFTWLSRVLRAFVVVTAAAAAAVAVTVGVQTDKRTAMSKTIITKINNMCALFHMFEIAAFLSIVLDIQNSPIAHIHHIDRQ